MKSIRHWTPQYIRSRLVEWNYQQTHPGHPWLTRSANEILASYLRPSDIGLEFGSGWSTLWLAKRIRHLTSVEHDALWYQKVSGLLNDSAQTNISYWHMPKDKEEIEGDQSAYVRTVDRIETESLDFVLVDGVYRDFCAQEAIRILRPGGVLIIDNVNWFLPSTSASPNSRTYQQGPSGAVWNSVYQSITEWRSIWTSSGVTDTTFFFKPCDLRR